MEKMLKNLLEDVNRRCARVDVFVHYQNKEVDCFEVDSLNLYDISEGVLIYSKNNLFKQCENCNYDCKCCDFNEIKENLDMRIYAADIESLSFNSDVIIKFFDDNVSKIDYIVMEITDKNRRYFKDAVERATEEELKEEIKNILENEKDDTDKEIGLYHLQERLEFLNFIKKYNLKDTSYNFLKFTDQCVL